MYSISENHGNEIALNKDKIQSAILTNGAKIRFDAIGVSICLIKEKEI